MDLQLPFSESVPAYSSDTVSLRNSTRIVKKVVLKPPRYLTNQRAFNEIRCLSYAQHKRITVPTHIIVADFSIIMKTIPHNMLFCLE